MALLGHVTPEMTLRYATLASPTIRSAYEAAMGKVRAGQLLPLTAVGAAPPVPDRVAWLHAEMLKTRLAHGYCARHLAAGPAPTPTSASSATTSSPPQAAAAITSPARRRPRPADDAKPAAGTTKSPATPASSQPRTAPQPTTRPPA